MLIPDVLSAFRKGKELANAETWKNRAIAGNALAALLTSGLGIAAAFGYRFNVDEATVQALAGGIAALWCVINGLLHPLTSARVGLPAKPGDDATGGIERAGDRKTEGFDYPLSGGG